MYNSTIVNWILLHYRIIQNEKLNVRVKMDSNDQIELSQNILLLSEAKHDGLEDLQTFYNNFRNMICKQLKKKGDIIKSSLKDLILDYDEVISNTFDQIILVWCLEKIHPKLPKLIIENLENKTSFESSKEFIFNYVPTLLNFDNKDTFEKKLNGHDQSNKNKSDILKEELNGDSGVCAKDDVVTCSEDEKEVIHHIKEVNKIERFICFYRDSWIVLW